METETCHFDELKKLGVFDVKDGSVELFFDDVGIVQKIIYRKRKRRRDGEVFEVRSLTKGSAVAEFDKDGVLQTVVYETFWKRASGK